MIGTNLVYMFLHLVPFEARWAMLVARFLAGIAAGGNALLPTYWTYAASEKDRSTAAALFDGAFCLGLAFGPGSSYSPPPLCSFRLPAALFLLRLSRLVHRHSPGQHVHSACHGLRRSPRLHSLSDDLPLQRGAYAEKGGEARVRRQQRSVLPPCSISFFSLLRMLSATSIRQADRFSLHFRKDDSNVYLRLHGNVGSTKETLINYPLG